MKPDVAKHLPLSPATLHVLLALSSGDLHGYGIMLAVARQAGGQYKIGPGTLYDNLKKLMSAGLIEDSQGEASDAQARRTYHLNELGGEVLAAEIERLDGVLREARRSLRLHEEEQA
ncbi:PadR family transcriptional regulator [Granulicella sp. WH15]|uniref:PadR family transcriptional regulator n=1 Tax=Granulicella sp. WH15 TaxID=2602070 RepID=UPI0013668187|nr:PadR family transcriptional regulator [Granulicella sp. WH15]QHN02203.1 PadR family transcriptional regulator [Granulicella sp. WH15]